MNHRIAISLPLALLAAPHLAAQTQAPAPMQRVEVTGSAAIDARRGDTAGRLTVGREDLARYGDSTLSEALKRQPGISVVNGEIRMRGLGSGYTQILVNDQPVPQSFSIDSISPALIDRIEIMRTANAEYGAQGIAGTINVILKKAGGAARQDLSLALRSLDDHVTPAGALRWSDQRGSLAWSLGLDLVRLTALSEGSARDTLREADDPLTSVRDVHELSVGKIDQLILAPRATWTFGGGDSLAWNTLLERTRRHFDQSSSETVRAGRSSAYPDNGFTLANNTHAERSDVTWTRAIGEARLLLKGAINMNARESDYLFRGAGAGGTLARRVLSNAIDNTATLSGKYLAPLGEHHSLGLGWDGGRTERSEARLQRDSSFAGAPLGVVDEDYQAVVHRMALFAQDEWSVTPRLQIYLGLRWEGLRTSTVGRLLDEVSSRASVASPIAQVLWKIPGSEKDQLRLALSRTYKAPLVANLIPRRYTVNNGNSPSNPDTRGNPALRPELAWGVEAAYERYVGKNGVASLSAYARRIEEVTVQTLYRENGAWISTPFNNGRAAVWGIEFDTRRSLGADVDLRANAARNWSRIDAVPGPANRLDAQVKASANLGVDYRAGTAHTVGANLNLQFGGPVRSSALLRSYTGPARSLEAYAVWKVDGGLQWRASASNILHRAEHSSRVYDDGATFAARDYATRGHTTWRIMLEKRL